MGVGVVPEFVTFLGDAADQGSVVVRPFARQEEGAVQVRRFQSVQDARRGSGAGSRVEREGYRAARRGTAVELGEEGWRWAVWRPLFPPIEMRGCRYKTRLRGFRCRSPLHRAWHCRKISGGTRSSECCSFG